jgi:predicted transposase/invertase (TIGR01784 family)
MIETNVRKQKNLEELTLLDDYMFAHVMRETRYLKPLLEYILQIKIVSIQLIDTQKTEKEGYNSKGIRLDVYVMDENGVVYNIEMQSSNKYNLPKRLRYYQSVMDVHILKPGDDYRKLNKTYVIFICNYDPFGVGQYVYTFENICREVPGLPLMDEAYKVIVNTKGLYGNISGELKEFISYLDGGRITGAYSRELDNAVRAIKDSEERRLEYMLLWVRDNEMRAEGYSEGHSEGFSDGFSEGAITDAIQIYNDEMHMTVEEITRKIMSRFGLDEKTALDYIAEISREKTA